MRTYIAAVKVLHGSERHAAMQRIRLSWHDAGVYNGGSPSTKGAVVLREADLMLFWLAGFCLRHGRMPKCSNAPGWLEAQHMLRFTVVFQKVSFGKMFEVYA